MRPEFGRVFSLKSKTAALFALLAVSACSSAPVRREVPPTEQARLYLEAAIAAQSEGDSTAALNYLVQAENRDPSLPEIHHLRGVAYASKKETSLAEESLRKALQLRPDYAEAQTTLGKVLLDEGRWAESEKWLTQAAANVLYGDAYKARTSLGILYYRKAEYPRSREQFAKAVSSDPARSCIAHYYLGHIDMMESRFDTALLNYERATQKFCAGFAEGHLATAVAFEKTHDLDRARKKYLEVTRSFPNTVAAEQARNYLKRLP